MKHSICFLAAALISVIALSASAQVRTIDTQVATLRLSEKSGDLIGLDWKTPELAVIGEARLGENFRILVPQKNYEANYFNSRDQQVSSIERTPDGVMCTYNSLRNERETVPLRVTTPGDYNEMNNGMRYGLVWDLAPRHYAASLDEPLTRPPARYMSELIRIRKEYADLLFLGRFNDTMGATVHGGANIRYSVFKPLQAAKSGEACVVVNFDKSPQTVDVGLDGLSGSVEVAMPFKADQDATLPVRLTIPGHQLAVVVKQ